MNPVQHAGARYLDEEALLAMEQPTDVGQGRRDMGSGMPCLTVIGFLFLTFNSGMAVYRSNGDYESIAFVGFSYVDLLLLFYCLRSYERAQPERCRSRELKKMKIAIWALTTLLTAMFCYKVAAVMPRPAAVLVWAMAGAAALGFYAFFVHQY